MYELLILRTRIDSIDKRLITALRERMEVVRLIGKLKKGQSLPFQDDERWREVLQKRSSEAQALGLDPQFIRDLYEVIHKAALAVEERA